MAKRLSEKQKDEIVRSFTEGKNIDILSFVDSYGALKEWTKAIDIAPNNHYLFYNRGLTYSKLQLLSQAIKDFDESIKLKPDFAPAFADRGMAYYELDQKDRACDDFKKSAKLKNKRAIIWIKDTQRSYWCIKK